MPVSLAEVKATLRANLGSPQNNQNSATACAGTEFEAENAKGQKVAAKVLGELSPKGKVQATLACLTAGCTETHTREQSDWHQSLNCRTHAGTTKGKLTDEQKLANKIAAAKAFLAANS